jgi:protein phosphatase
VPSVLDRFTEDGVEYAVIEQPVGQLLWDANDDPAYPAWVRFGWMAELAEGLKALHDAGGIVEGLRPDILVLNEAGHLVFNDLTGLLSLPLPANPMVAGNLYTAPEMIIDPASADGRADLYSFGAMLYALYIGRELTEMDFEKPYVPKPFVFRFPDTNPQLGRIIMKTFVRDPLYRFPTDEASKEDATGMLELAKCLRILGRLMSQVRLEIAGWTNTGKVRTNNEDAFALVHSSSSREESLGDRVLLVLCDGMGGYEAGEVAAAMTIDYVRQTLLKDPLFQGLSNVDPSAVPEFDLGKCHDTLVRTLQEINKHIYTIAKTPGSGRRGMGCTTEVLYIDNERLASAHVGDSRVYHYSNGRLTQLTRDQTLVARLVELGQLSAEEAENHPRKNELQQAMGSQPIVEPLTYHVPLRQGDWILVCSDGLINHVDHNTLTEMLQRSDSAEMAARRLVNLANAYGGSDNTTVVAIRCT